MTVEAEHGGLVYAITGGPAGMFYQPIDARDQKYVKVDNESLALPSSVTPADASLPTGSTDKQYIVEGGPWAVR